MVTSHLLHLLYITHSGETRDLVDSHFFTPPPYITHWGETRDLVDSHFVMPLYITHWGETRDLVDSHFVTPSLYIPHWGETLYWFRGDTCHDLTTFDDT